MIDAVLGPDTPVTTPEAFTVATLVLALLHVPVPVASLSVVVKPTHVDAIPVIAAGEVLTVTGIVVKQAPIV
jgi:hypothetical protein